MKLTTTEKSKLEAIRLVAQEGNAAKNDVTYDKEMVNTYVDDYVNCRIPTWGVYEFETTRLYIDGVFTGWLHAGLIDLDAYNKINSRITDAICTRISQLVES